MPTTIEFAAERESWNVYRLEDGAVLKVRLMVVSVKRDGDNLDGSPKYAVTWQTAMHVEPSGNVKVPIRHG